MQVVSAVAVGLLALAGCSSAEAAPTPSGPPTALTYEAFGDGPARYVNYMQGGLGDGDDGQKVDVPLPFSMHITPGRPGTYAVRVELGVNPAPLREDTRQAGCRIVDQLGHVLVEQIQTKTVICSIQR